MTTETSETVVRAWVRPGPVRTALLVMGSAGAAAIHFAMVPAHAAESTTLAVGFVVVAWLQAAFAVGALVRPSRGLVLVGAVLNLAALSIWGWSRLFGLPLGIGGGDIESVAAVDALCAALELAVVVAAVWPPLSVGAASAASSGVDRRGRSTPARPPGRRAAPAFVAVAGIASLLVVGATSAVLASTGTHVHIHDNAHETAHGDHAQDHDPASSHEHESSPTAPPDLPACETRRCLRARRCQIVVCVVSPRRSAGSPPAEWRARG
jgi:hypothetical protein